MAAARANQPQLATLIDAFGNLEPLLDWRRRPGAEAVGPAFADGHANAIIVGPDGLEASDEVRIGVSVLAPDVRYPDHRHPPDELYVVLSEGEWRQAAAPWFEPGVGGIVYNPSNTQHAMRSGRFPLLAIWCLWLGTAARPI
jgi:quercetin dioxygenase-like cupin family protein